VGLTVVQLRLKLGFVVEKHVQHFRNAVLVEKLLDLERVAVLDRSDVGQVDTRV